MKSQATGTVNMREIIHFTSMAIIGLITEDQHQILIYIGLYSKKKKKKKSVARAELELLRIESHRNTRTNHPTPVLIKIRHR